ncbi:DUF4416 family protein [Desulfohalobium retbaense]|uniref:GTP-binding protein n=1 Tax=Desulfohalobium retbaense (strain ATCC 49708 / DSM 5692 / JCM 16813 / HR100) TaxID=485915 RepID=C8WZX4_DESRD|nr:DUF4416 family protein [Desulfohalobium retbaense]ACV67599.1 conserved hypothetical protein [Desulfohalobium retbaense DSM 5692]
MSTPKSAPKAVLVIPVLTSVWQTVWPTLRPRLEAHFGPVHDFGDALFFTHTTYYNTELGTPLYRRLLYADRFYPQDRLAEAKLVTNALEDAFRDAEGNRRINLDPGLLSLERLVLATGKGFTHRIYLKEGIWADLTLMYQKGGWRAFDWTFADYADAPLQAWLTRLRDEYKQARKQTSQTGVESFSGLKT